MAVAVGTSQADFAPELELSQLSGSKGFVMNGEAAGNQLGTSVSSAGDINGDGIDDLVLGAPLWSRNQDPRDYSGAAYVIFGGQEGFFSEPNLPPTLGQGFTIQGAIGEGAGFSVSAADDINGDGIDDLIIGAPYASRSDSYAGSTYVVFGRSNGFEAVLDLTDLTKLEGKAMVINGDVANDFSGCSVGAANVNGDAFDDVIIGASDALNGKGKTYVIFGSNTLPTELNLGELTNGTVGFTIVGEVEGDAVGKAVGTAGNINGDGFEDLIIGAPTAEGAGAISGAAYVIFGSAAPVQLDLSALGNAGFKLLGNNDHDSAGSSVAAAGDINGDTVDDVIVGAPGSDSDTNTDSGSSYVVFGSAVPNYFSSPVQLSELGSGGVAFIGEGEGDRSGSAVNAAGDINGDGTDDLVIGAPGWSRNQDPNDRSGAAYVVFGRSMWTDPLFDLSLISGINGVRLNGANAGDATGRAVGSAADLNADGTLDLVIGAPMADSDGSADSGAAYVVFDARADSVDIIFADGFE